MDHADRSQLGFADAVRESFSFLVRDLGYSLARSEVTFVRYESGKLFLNVFHGRSSFALGVEIGRQQVIRNALSEQKYALETFMGISRDQGNLQGYWTRDAEQLRRFVAHLASLTRRYAWGALKGDEAAFEAARAFNSDWSRRYLEGIEASRLRASGDDAWHARDWPRVIDVYERLLQLKTADARGSEIGRLRYARKKLGFEREA